MMAVKVIAGPVMNHARNKDTPNLFASLVIGNVCSGAGISSPSFLISAIMPPSVIIFCVDSTALVTLSVLSDSSTLFGVLLLNLFLLIK